MAFSNLLIVCLLILTLVLYMKLVAEKDIYRSIGRKIEITASDISRKVIEKARKEFPHLKFKVNSIYKLEEENGSYDLVVASEVLEHLEYPEEALEELFRISKQYVFVSVPHEPIWRIANFLRGKYWLSLGNTPGHIQHWNKNKIIKLVSKYGDIRSVNTPFPWIMILSEKRNLK